MPGQALEHVCGTPWAITEEGMSLILDVVTRVKGDLLEGRIEALEARLGRKLDNAHEATVRDGVATVPVVGPIARYMNVFTRISGGTSVETLATDLQRAADDTNVRAIVLAVDSPGGEANGVHELSRLIREVDKKKPVVAYVGGLGASGGYWLASAARKVVTNEAGILGSIGVVATYRKAGEADKNRIKILSSVSPRKQPDVETEEGRRDIQATVDALGDVFVDEVARNRGVDRERVLKRFGQGSVLVGRQAVKAGMADALGTYEQVHADLAAGKFPERRRVAPAPAKPKGKPAMNLFEKIGRALAGAPVDEGDEAGAENDAAVAERFAATLRPAKPAPPAAPAPGPDPRVAELEAKLKAARASALQGYGVQAQAAWDVLKAAHKVLPFAREAFCKAFVQAAFDDAAGLPGVSVVVTDTGVEVSEGGNVAGGRLAALRAAYDALGQHDFTRSSVAANGRPPETAVGLKVLNPYHDGDGKGDPASPESAYEYASAYYGGKNKR